MAVVYCYHCIPTGKKYIGVTINEIRRKSQHKNNNETNRYPDLALYRAMSKYGWDSFIYGVVEYCLERDLKEKERYWISELNTMKEGYNMTAGGDRYNLTEEHKQKISNKLKGRTMSEEWREKLSQAGKGRKLTEQDKQKIVEYRQKTYRIEYNTGEVEIVTNMKRFCLERGYNRSVLVAIVSGKVKTHKDIVSVTKIEVKE